LMGVSGRGRNGLAGAKNRWERLNPQPQKEVWRALCSRTPGRPSTAAASGYSARF
jgi:hypothetical protein